ncbi:MAG: hypothetical protein HUJ31_16645 [Pseudomonadales bacterium]|nr:hypothetical protein [Pseudomonadales bacterium]
MYYQIDTLERLLIVDLVGQPTVGEVVELIGKIRNDNRYQSTLNALIDLSRCDLSGFTTSQIRSLISTVDHSAEDSRIAFLAPGDLAYGMARIYVSESSFVNERPRNVFKEYLPAMTWLKSEQD